MEAVFSLLGRVLLHSSVRRGVAVCEPPKIQQKNKSQLSGVFAGLIGVGFRI